MLGKPLQRKRSLSAEPIRNAYDIERIRRLLSHKPRDLLLFEFATQTGLPATILLKLKVKDLQGLNVGDRLSFQGTEVNRACSATINETVYQTFCKYLEQLGPSEDDYLFKSRKGSKALSVSSVSRLVKGWFKRASLIGLSGILSLRKTWEVHYRSNPQSKPKSYIEESSNQALKPIQLPTRQEVVYKELQKAIVSGRILPGERLGVEDVARQMKVSRIPVREAFGRLEARGFISTTGNRGIVVNELSRASLKEILELRIMLEGLAAEKAAVRCSEEAINRVQALHQQYATARKGIEADQLLHTNMQFHLAVYREANMPILQEIIFFLWSKVSPYYHILFRQAEKPNPRAGIEYHQKIVDAMRNHNPKEIRRWVQADLTDSAMFVIELFDIYRKAQKGG
ncbi:MAG: FCD domain-containing protein [Deltaproteobacteria bacterium]|nr:FCD domain-containing protein [Deltaproteobacteria bacterium]MBW1993822.1 FCD domain-containing protein [Deltaproteobacteria bacterium]MBW2152129.1 FCD domain-containing protein [Deltaproteobacteria bacterium]